MADELYSQLPVHIQSRINDTFYALLAQSRGQGDIGGGFIQEPQPHDDQTQIPLDLIPSALGRLNLPDDDDEVLTVFRNAASGWKGGSYSEDVGMSTEGGDYELGVSLEDWRSVCAVLLEDEDEEADVRGRDVDVDMDVGGGGFVCEDSGKGGAYGGGGFIPEDDDGDNDDDAYNDDDDEGDSEEGAASDEDFIPGPRTRRTRGTVRDRSADSTPAKAQSKSDDRAAVDMTKLTAKQKQAAFDTFALFFPDTAEDELKGKRIMIKDVQRVAALLKEKLKAEEFIDMLEMFSTSADKSMSYDDFVRMLVVARLI